MVDVSKELPGLLRVDGMHQWPVRLRLLAATLTMLLLQLIGLNDKVYHSWDASDKAESRLNEQMFAPSAAESAKLHLERCVQLCWLAN